MTRKTTAEESKVEMNEYRSRWETALRLPGEQDTISSALAELQRFFPTRGREEITNVFLNGEALCAKRWHELAVNPRSEASLTQYYDGTDLKLFSLMHFHTVKWNDGPLNYVVALEVAKQQGCRTYMDYGSGVGSGGLLFAQAGLEVTLCDISSPLLTFAKWRFAERRLKAVFVDLKHEKPTTQVGLITCLEVLEHVPDPLKLLRTLHGYLRDGGLLIASAPFWHDDERPGHIIHNPKLSRKFRGQGFQHRWDLKAPFRGVLKEPVFIMQKVQRSALTNRFLSLHDYYVPEVIQVGTKQVWDALRGTTRRR